MFRKESDFSEQKRHVVRPYDDGYSAIEIMPP